MKQHPQPGTGFKVYRSFTEFGMIPFGLMRRKGISPTAKLVYGFLAKCEGKEGFAFPSMSSIAEAVGVKERAARTAIAELESAGLIERQYRFSQAGQRSSVYRFIWADWLSDDPVANLTTPTRQENAAPPRQHSAAIKEHDENNKNTDYERLATQAPPARPLSLSPIARELYAQHRQLHPNAPPPSTRIAADMMMAAKRNGMDEREAVEEFTVFATYRIAGLKEKHLPESYRWWVVAWTNHLVGVRTSMGNFRPELTEPTVPIEYDGRAAAIMEDVYGIN